MGDRPPSAHDQALFARELHLFNLYRVFEALLLLLVVVGSGWLVEFQPSLPAVTTVFALLYLAFSITMVVLARRRVAGSTQVLVGVAVDILVAVLAIQFLPQATQAVLMMLVFNVALASVLLPKRMALATGTTAAVAVVIQATLFSDVSDVDAAVMAQRGLLAAGLIAAAWLAWTMAELSRNSHALAKRRTAEAQSMGELNETILRRMRTGVMLVEGEGRVRLANEAAIALLDAGSDPQDLNLATAAPQLAQRLARWRRKDLLADVPLKVGHESNEILPRFLPFRPNDDSTVLIFLDDAAHLARRAESLSLAALGRFSASLAHEIRNPLAAINYAAQLLDENSNLNAEDRQLIDVVLQQTKRANTIVDSVLSMARRENAMPQRIDLSLHLRNFQTTYTQMYPDTGRQLRLLNHNDESLPAMVDVGHLDQILTILINNALTHGRYPNRPAQVIISATCRHGRSWIDVMDRGPGVKQSDLKRLFQPFHTTDEHGNGLGLYIARELAHANQGQLTYHAIAGGGSNFRITLPAGDSFNMRD